eukprot:jgi/Undpi1/301/HiC_scaffold_1.g00297.m1
MRVPVTSKAAGGGDDSDDDDANGDDDDDDGDDDSFDSKMKLVKGGEGEEVGGVGELGVSASVRDRVSFRWIPLEFKFIGGRFDNGGNGVGIGDDEYDDGIFDANIVGEREAAGGAIGRRSADSLTRGAGLTARVATASASAAPPTIASARMPPLTTLSRADGSDSSTPAKTAAALAVKAGGETEASKRGDAGSTSALASSSGVGGGDGHSASGDGRRGGLIKATAEGGVSGLGLPLLGMQTVAEEQEADMSLTIAAGGRRALPRASAEVNLAGRRTGSGGGGMENGEAGRVAGVVLDRSSAVAGTAMAAPAVLERTAAAAVVGTVAGAEGSADTAGRGISTTSGGRFSGTVQGMDAADAVGRAATPGRRFSARDSGVDIFSSAPAAASGVSFARAPSSAWSEVVVNGTRYLKTEKIGRGGSSEVFRVVSPDGQMMALKVVKVDDQGEQGQSLLESYSNEIALLKQFQGSRFIIGLENAEVDRSRGIISIVLELGETDLDSLLRQHKAVLASSVGAPSWAMGDIFPGGMEANYVRVIWRQMLQAVHAMHEQRVVHSDLKPANFVFVKGCLKLIDFGIAKAINSGTTNISRDSRVGTVNYMCPEAVEDTGNGEYDPETGRQAPVMKLGRPSDIWSLGCILYQMTHGKTPFSHLGMLQTMRAITNREHVIPIAPMKDVGLVETLRGCLQRDPSDRIPIAGAGGLLSHAYLHPIAAIESSNEKFAARTAERVAEVERELTRRHEEATAVAVGKAVAAEQARQAAGFSIAKSAVKQIIEKTVRVLRSETGLKGAINVDQVTGMVIGSDRSRGGGNGHPVSSGSRQ